MVKSSNAIFGQVSTLYVCFKSHGWGAVYITVPVAQWIARWTSNPKVPGSNPGRDAYTFLSLF